MIGKGRMTLVLAMVVVVAAGCIRVKLEDCPPMQVTLTVKDKNYFNIDDAVKLGLAERKADNLPFRDYIHTIYYIIRDAEGNVVAEQKNTEVKGEDANLLISLPATLQYGTYEMTVWGNMDSEEPLGDNPDTGNMEVEGAAANDIFLASGTFDYQYGKENFSLGMERTKGNLLIKAEGIPDNIDFSTKNVQDVYATVDAAFSYSGLTDIHTELEWQEKNEVETQTLACPSPTYEGTTLEVSFIDRSAVEQQTQGRAAITSPVLRPENVNITMGRNEITILKYVYDNSEEGFDIFVRVNDRWEQIHGMILD